MARSNSLLATLHSRGTLSQRTPCNMTLYPNHPDVEKREMLRIDGIIDTQKIIVESGAPARASIRPPAIRSTPTGALIRLPQDMFFSIAMIVPRTSIQPRFATPTANINIISAQQQPMQKSP